ncbi:MAG: mercuric reductase [Nitrospirota bacterium]
MTGGAPVLHRWAPHGALVLPDDVHNQRLVANVHPPGWVNPEPAGRYNLVVIGAGPAGLVTAAIASALGAKVALVEKHLMGGDCLNVGCVPSKGMISAARAWAMLRRGAEFGFAGTEHIRYDFGAVMARMRELRARMSRVDSAQRFASLGVDVFLGEGRFASPDSVEVAGKTLRFAKAAICTGARAAAPPILGLAKAGYRTNETIFELTERPARLAVIGAGPIGCEMAQAFARFGTRVWLFERTERILHHEDGDAARIVQDRMQRDGVSFLFQTAPTRVERRGAEKVLHYRANNEARFIEVDEILIGVGRAPNVEGLHLEQAGVEYDAGTGVKVNHRLQSSNPRIFAAGDVCFPHKFTHAADATAQVLIQNALFPHPFGLGWARTDALVIPWTTYTDPEVAHVGLYERDAREKGLAVATFTVKLDEVDRAILDGEDDGFARVHLQKGTDKILGATIVAPHAGELISEVTVAMRAGLGLATVGAAIHPYPTQAEVIKKLANAWRRTTLTAGKKAVLARWFRWTRGG